MRPSLRNKGKVSEDDERRDGDESQPMPAKVASAPSTQVRKFPYGSVPSLIPVVDVPPIPIKHLKPTETVKSKYTRKAPIEDGVDIEAVVDRILGSEVTITQRELLAIASKLKKAYSNALRPQRVPKNVHFAEEVSVETDIEPVRDVEYVQVAALSEPVSLKGVSVNQYGQETESWHVSDPITEYLDMLPVEERAKQVFVTDTSSLRSAPDLAPLRVIPALVNEVHEEEALLDPGSQLVGMSQEAAADCKIIWDPSLRITMQDANGGMKETVGLAKDVPFRFGQIIVHLQVHVLAAPPYRLLLGRPFDVIALTQTNNFEGGKQIISITDPNTKATATIPTYPKGELPKSKEANFWGASRNS